MRRIFRSVNRVPEHRRHHLRFSHPVPKRSDRPSSRWSSEQWPKEECHLLGLLHKWIVWLPAWAWTSSFWFQVHSCAVTTRLSRGILPIRNIYSTILFRDLTGNWRVCAWSPTKRCSVPIPHRYGKDLELQSYVCNVLLEQNELHRWLPSPLRWRSFEYPCRWPALGLEHPAHPETHRRARHACDGWQWPVIHTATWKGWALFPNRSPPLLPHGRNLPCLVARLSAYKRHFSLPHAPYSRHSASHKHAAASSFRWQWEATHACLPWGTRAILQRWRYKVLIESLNWFWARYQVAWVCGEE